MNKNIQNSIEKVSNSFPSLFSKEDVIKVLQELNQEMESEPEKGPRFNIEEFKNRFLSKFETSLCREDSSDLVDYDSAELSIGYNNRIEIDCIEVQVDRIKDIAEEAFDECVPQEEEDFLIDPEG